MRGRIIIPIKSWPSHAGGARMLAVPCCFAAHVRNMGRVSAVGGGSGSSL